MPTFDVVGHEHLSAAAEALGETALDSHAAVAEALLDSALTATGRTALTEAPLTVGTTAHDRATLAVVWQVNFQVESGVEGEVYGSLSRGDRQFGFRGGVLNPMPTVSPRAMALARAAVGDPATTSASWPTAGGVR